MKNAVQPTCAGGCASARSDVFLTKFASAGNSLAYSTYLGGWDDAGNFGNDIGNGVAVNPAGEAFVAGFTNSPNFPVTTGAFQRTFAGGDEGVGGDAFVAKFAASGSSLIYSTYLGGQHDDTAQAVAIDGAGNAHVAGYTDSDNFPVVQPFQSTLLGDFDAFVTKVNATGSGLVYSSYLGGKQGDVISFSVANGVAVDAAGNAYYGGWTNAHDFKIVNAFQPTIAGEYDTFITKVSP